MYVSADGSYRSLTTGGASTEGKFYLPTYGAGSAEYERIE